jgi:hypothetical protein
MRDPTPQEAAEFEAELLRRQAERAGAKAAVAPKRPIPSLPPGDGGISAPPSLTEEQAAEWARTYRANYWRHSAEIVALMEAGLVAALKADGFEVPPRTAEERLRELRARDSVR